jgi:predicted DNA-binding transcriptional regulator AlpA
MLLSKPHEQADVTLPDLRTLTIADICRALQINRDTLSELRRSGGFPDPIRIGKFNLRWRVTDVQAWMSRGGYDAQKQSAST